MNSVVRLVVSALWVVAYVLIDVAADYGHVLPGSAKPTPASAIQESPSSLQLRAWLARRLSSPPGFPRLATV